MLAALKQAVAIFSRQRMSSIKALAAKKATDGESLIDSDYSAHYSGGKSYGSLLTFLTLFSTLFSGYTVLGVPQEGADLGFFALRWMYVAFPATAALAMFVPRLRRLAVERHYNSLGDLIADRYVLAFLSLLPSVAILLIMSCTL